MDMSPRQNLYSTLQVINDEISKIEGVNTLLHRDGQLTANGKLSAASILNFSQSVGEAPAMPAETHVMLLNLIVENKLHVESEGE